MRKIQCAVCMSENYLCNKCKYQTKSWLCLELLDIRILKWRNAWLRLVGQMSNGFVKKITEYYSTYIKNAPICIYYPTFDSGTCDCINFFVRSMHQSNETLISNEFNSFWKHNNFDNLQRPSSLRCDDSSRFRHPQKIESMAGHAPALLVVLVQFWLSPFHSFCHWKVEAATSATSVKSWRTCFNFAQSNPIRCRCWVSWEGFSCILCATSCTPKRINHDQTNRIQQKRVEPQCKLLICYVNFRCKYFLVP